MSKPSEAEKGIQNGKYVITDNLDVVTKSLPIEVVIDATGVPETGAGSPLIQFIMGNTL